jgi:secreted trypsin-like serine protease
MAVARPFAFYTAVSTYSDFIGNKSNGKCDDPSRRKAEVGTSIQGAETPLAGATEAVGPRDQLVYGSGNTLRTLSSADEQEACRVTSATLPPWVTMKTRNGSDT